MPTGVHPLVLVFIAAVVMFGGGVYWWANRSPSTRRGRSRPIPLFGSDVGDTTVPRDNNQPSVAASRQTTAFHGGASREAPRGSSQAAPGGVAGAMSASPTAEREVPPRRAPVRDSSSITPTGGVRTPTPPSAFPSVFPTPSNAAQAQSPTTTPPAPRRAPVPTPTPATAHASAATSTPGFANAITAWTTTAASAKVPGKLVEGKLVRFSVPTDGTLQFLPGRLEVSAGSDSGREIRFVRLPGPEGVEVTFGRSEGPLYRHVQLNDLTVSRAHARMRMADGRWHLANLSQTNPVAHNGRILGNDEEQPLEDGDRIEMGEVVFRFRSR